MLEDWRIYNEWLESPDEFIDFAFYSLVTACLGRKVWLGDDNSKLFLNTYTSLVGPPGSGKNRVISRVTKLLMAVRKDGVITYDDLVEYPELDEMAVPIGPNSITRSHLVTIMSKLGSMEKLPDGKLMPHASLSLCLNELASLLNGFDVLKTRDLLVELYDCEPYSSGTSGKGQEKIMNGCLNILAGTNPDFMQECHTSSVLKTGFSARMWFVWWGGKTRFKEFESGKLTPRNIEARNRLLKFVLKISKLVGPMRFSLKAHKLLKDWYEQDFDREVYNRSHKLADYYARKNIHIRKLAAAIAIAKNQNLEDAISEEDVWKAFREAKRMELTMDMALSTKPKNPTVSTIAMINDYLQSARTATLDELFKHVMELVNTREFIEAIRIMSRTAQIKFVEEEGDIRVTSRDEELPKPNLMRTMQMLESYAMKI